MECIQRSTGKSQTQLQVTQCYCTEISGSHTATGSTSETSVSFCDITHCSIPEGGYLQTLYIASRFDISLYFLSGLTRIVFHHFFLFRHMEFCPFLTVLPSEIMAIYCK